MNCQCGQSISVPKLTGALCTSCYKLLKTSAPKTITIVSEPETLQAPIVPDKIPEGLRYKSTPVINPPKQSMICNDCASTEHNTEDCPIKHEPTKVTETQDPTKVYCQSCIERGYGLTIATRVWQEGYPICEACFEPLLNNILSYDNTREDVENKVILKINPEKPFLKQAYDLLEIPEAFRLKRSDDVLNNRNDIWNYHASALVNKTVEQIAQEYEDLSVILFQIKLAQEPRADYINRVKYAEREKAGLKSIEKAEKEVTKKPSKVKMDKNEKIAKSLGLSVEVYLQMAAEARKTEFNKVIGKK